MPRVPELDGLRALLAWWVVIYHARGPNFTAAFQIDHGPLAFLSHGELAVDLFMILSGFVIFFLLDREHEGYGRFLLRRFLRLFPVYALCFVVMLLLQGIYIDNLEALRPRVTASTYDVMITNAVEPTHELSPQLLVHALMLHGPIPLTWLRNAAGAFLMPAWSISLEWQFYLVAPLIFWLVRGGGPVGVALCLLMTIVAFATRRLWPPMGFDAFLPIRLHTFMVGIASYYALKWLVTRAELPRRLLAWAPLASLSLTAAFLVANVVRLGPNGAIPGPWLPLAIWSFVFACLLATGLATPGPAARVTRRLLLWRPLRWLGLVSYSTYLVHWPILTLCTALFRRSLDMPSPMVSFWLHVAVSFPLIVAASWLLHRTVEAPAMELGRRLSRRAVASR